MHDGLKAFSIDMVALAQRQHNLAKRCGADDTAAVLSTHETGAAPGDGRVWCLILV
jgi:hypothetical protein